MRNNERLIYGLLLTAAIFFTATLISVKTHLGIEFFPNFFVSLTIELMLSAIAIIALRKYLSFHIAAPKFNSIIKPVVYSLVATIVINGLMTVITTLAGEKIEVPKAIAELKPVQVILFIFIYASIAEELLFRGLLLNFLKPLAVDGIFILKRKISLPVMVSAVAFGLAHLVLITTGVSTFFLIRIIIFTISLGLLAGYYQEKYSNHAYAIMVHMAGNSLAVIAAFTMH